MSYCERCTVLEDEIRDLRRSWGAAQQHADDAKKHHAESERTWLAHCDMQNARIAELERKLADAEGRAELAEHNGRAEYNRAERYWLEIVEIKRLHDIAQDALGLDVESAALRLMCAELRAFLTATEKEVGLLHDKLAEARAVIGSAMPWSWMTVGGSAANRADTKAWTKRALAWLAEFAEPLQKKGE